MPMGDKIGRLAARVQLVLVDTRWTVSAASGTPSGTTVSTSSLVGLDFPHGDLVVLSPRGHSLYLMTNPLFMI